MNNNPNNYPAPGDEPQVHEHQQPREQIGSAFVDYLVEREPDADSAARMRRGFDRHGTAFALYLALPDIDKHAETLEGDFESAFIGQYDDRRTFIRDTIECFSWEDDLNRLLAGDALLRAVVTLSNEQILGFIRDHYELIELEDGLYVFEAAPPAPEPEAQPAAPE